MAKNKKAFFGIDASKVEIKKLLNKEFLELSLKAISDEKPNRNDSWFTKESLENCKDTVYNKPVLGFFKNNDFVSHNGKWSKDEELDMEFWDTLGEGERCIGLVRESDNVEIITDDKGLNWLTFSCAIWTQYSYKQVKRLLKDAIKAQKEGGPAKNISVEVSLTDYEDIYDPVSGKQITKINGFELMGVTILGSRNGIKVEPGIEGAELSVVDIMDTPLFDKQVKNLRIAYEKLGDTKNNIIKEDASMNVDEEVRAQEGTELKPENFEEHTNEQTNNQDIPTPEGKEPKAENFDNGAFESKPETESVTESTDNAESEAKAENFEADPIYDLPWFIERVHRLKKDFDCIIKYYKENGVKGGEYVLAILEKQAKIYSNNCKELADVLAKVCAEDYEDNPEEIAYERSKCEDCCDCNELYSKVEAKTKEVNELYATKEESDNKIKELEDTIAKFSDYEELKAKVQSFEANALMEEAKALVDTAELSEEQAKQIYEDCKNGKFTTADEIKIAVAVMAFDSKPKSTVKTIYQAPVQETPTIKASNDPETLKAKTSWEILEEYNKGK